MSSTTIALIAFACFSCASFFGLRVRAVLPDNHISDDSREIVKLGAGLIATLAAMILGLLVSSAKSSLDSMNGSLTQDGAKIILLDRMLASYGPETAELRGMLRAGVVNAIGRIWPEERAQHGSLSAIESTNNLERLQERLNALSPQSASQQKSQSQALQLVAELAQSRWLLIEESQLTLPTPFLIVLLFWLSLLFAAFGLLSPGNATVVSVLLLCALSLSGAIFLIMEMNTPVTGIIKVSSVPFQKALANLGR